MVNDVTPPSGTGNKGRAYKDCYNKYFKPNAENFFDIATRHGLDPRFIFCIGIHESAFGTSNIANDKGNFFGWNANDSNPYGDATSFYDMSAGIYDMSAGIETVCKGLANNYVSDKGSWYNWILDKGYDPKTIEGIGVRYASDPNWASGIEGHMSNIFGYTGILGNGDFLQVANQIHEHMEKSKYTYSTSLPPLPSKFSEMASKPYTCCATYVSWVLYQSGYTDQGYIRHNVSSIKEYCISKGFQEIKSYDALQAGDIVITSNEGHVQIYAGNGQWFNAGSTEAIRRASPYNQGNWARRNFVRAYRIK